MSVDMMAARMGLSWGAEQVFDSEFVLELSSVHSLGLYSAAKLETVLVVEKGEIKVVR